MKNYCKLSAISLLFVCTFLLHGFVAQGQNFKIVRGERPAIDLSKVPVDAYEHGVLKIKLTREAISLINEDSFDGVLANSVNFGIESIDALGREFGVRRIEAQFGSTALKNSYSERHHAWGFHQWFKLYVNESVDIRVAVNAFMELAEIEFAEPEYRKRLIGNAPPSDRPVSEKFNPAEPTAFWTPDDPRYNEQWHYHNTGQQNGTPDADIDLPEAWEMEKGNSELLVAIVDEGIQFNHPDIAANMWDGIGFNFVAGNSNIVPGNHGTHVAGTVAAVNNNATGVSGIAGGDGSGNGIRLMSAQVFTASGSGGFDLAPVWAADNGAAISQNSWGYTTVGVYEQSVLDAIDYFNVNGGGDALVGGGITIFAAGNDGTEGSWYPGFYSGTFAVAATNNQDIKSWYSNYGDWVDISAPGGETNNVNARGVLSTLNNNSYGFYQGTSMACPHVSGVAALVGSTAYGEITPQDLAEILQNSVDNHYGVNPSYLGKLGTGRLNAFNALIEAESFLTGVRNPASFGASAATPYQVDLSWTPNTDNNPVMVAWSSNGVFGTPAEGVAYLPGDLIPGGGTVLYKGIQTAFQHSGLEPATAYYYKAWSYNDDLQYSSGRSASVTTACEPFDLPFNENFEDLITRPICWNQENVSGGLNWIVGAGNGEANPPSAHDGSLNIYHKLDDVLADQAVTRLVTPQLQLSGLSSTELRFWYTNARRTFIIWNFQDELKVYYKNSAGGQWSLLQTYNSNVTSWSEIVIPLPNPTDDYYIAFEAVANAGFGVCLDKIAVTGAGGGTIYTISAIASANGTIQPEGDVAVNQGANQDFQINANTGYQISSLVVDGSTVAEVVGLESYVYAFTNVSSNHSITADFTLKTCIVETNVSPAGSGTVSGAGNYTYGQTVTLSANPGANYEFSKWTVNGTEVSVANPYSFTVQSDVVVTAVFTVKQTFAVTVLVDPPGSGTITGEGNYTFLQSVSLLATPAENFVFVAWMENGELRSTLNPFTFFIGTDRNFTAVFASNSTVDENSHGHANIYPNPAISSISLELREKATVYITDLNGLVVYASESEAGTTEIEMSGLEKGIYFVHLRYKDYLKTSRVIKL